MKAKRLLSIFGLFAVLGLLVACQPAGNETDGTATEEAEETPMPEPATAETQEPVAEETQDEGERPPAIPATEETTEPATDLPAAAVVARDTLAKRLGIAASAVEVVSFRERQWRDSCLGLGGPNEMCLQAITPGFQVMLRAANRTYEARTNERGTAVRFANGVVPQGGRWRGEPVVVLRRSGGIDGEVFEWRLYRDGYAERAGGSAESGSPEGGSSEGGSSGQDEAGEGRMVPNPRHVPNLLADLEAAGFFDLVGNYMPEDTCCDRYHYTLSVTWEGKSNTIETMGGTEDVPPPVWESIERVQSLMLEIFPEPIIQ